MGDVAARRATLAAVAAALRGAVDQAGAGATRIDWDRSECARQDVTVWLLVKVAAAYRLLQPVRHVGVRLPDRAGRPGEGA